MKPVIGPCNVIVEQALALGLLCRPVLGHTSRIGVGEGLEVGRDSFWLHHAGDPSYPVQTYAVSPFEMTLDWELLTKDLLRDEYRKVCEVPW